MTIPAGVDPREYTDGVCRSKRDLPNVSFAANYAWLLSQSHHLRLAVYRCPGCRNLHVTKNLEPFHGVLCTYPQQVNP